MIVVKKAACNDNIMVASEQQKNVFREVLLDLVGINFGNCVILIDPYGYLVITSDVFDVGYVPFERSPYNNLAAQRLTSIRWSCNERSVVFSCVVFGVSRLKVIKG